MTTPHELDSMLAAAIERCASPTEAQRAIARLLDRHPTLAHHLATNPPFRDRLVAVTSASRSLTRLLHQHPDAIDVLVDADQLPPRPTGRDLDATSLAHWKSLELLRIAARDLTGLDQLPAVGAALSTLAATVFDAACTLSTGRDGASLAVIGMGKFGGNELNYSSDVDVVFVGDGPRDELVRQAQHVMEIASHAFRVDTNLRPEGRDGPLVRTLDSYETYWHRWAEPWELQALLKARFVAGDRVLGQRFEDTAQRWLWSHPFETEDLRSLRRLKARSESEAQARQEPGTDELKRSPGGIRDIEFTAQLLQLVHGHLDAELRSPNTLATLAELGRAGYVDPSDAATLRGAYDVLRRIEHRLQLVEEQQTHTVPADPADREHLARVLGYRGDARRSASEEFAARLRHTRNKVRTIHERVYFRPLLEAFAASSPADATLSPRAMTARLTAFGFTDTARTQMAVRELTKGLNRSSRMMQQLLPLLLDWLSNAPDPDLGLLMLRNLLTGTTPERSIVDAFRDSPDAARRTCALFGTSRLLGEILMHNPDIVTRLPHAERLATSGRADLVAGAAAVMGWRDTMADKQEAMRRWKQRQLLGVAARDLFEFSDIAEVERDLSSLAEASIQAAIDAYQPRVRFAVIGLGRFGAAELSYASDLDMLFVYEGDGTASTEEAAKLASGLLRFLGGDTPAQRVWELDLGLRPEGRQGVLARRIDAYEQYWATYAEPWERMAMTRARVVAGDAELGRDLLAVLDPHVWGSGLTDNETRDIRRIKARMEAERIPAGEDPQFHLKLGRGSLSDVEFTVQLRQLQAGIRGTSTLGSLDALVAADEIDADDAEVLGEAFRFCEVTRNRWYLVNSGPGDALPTQLEPLLWLARSLGTNPSGLRDQYRRVTRRSRRVVEQLFYGQA